MVILIFKEGGTYKMRNKILSLMLVSIFLVTLMSISVSSEMWYWNTVNLDYDDQTVAQHGYYQFDDTSAKGVGRNKPIDLTIWYDVEGLPYDLTPTYAGNVDWCNLTITHLENEYGTEFVAWQGVVGGEYINTTTTVDSYLFENTINHTNGQLEYSMKDKDGLTVDMKCHYTDGNSTFVDNILFGRYTTFFGAYQCDDCEEYSLEELSNTVERNDEIIIEETQVYENIQSVVDMNYQLWLIASWLVKIGFVIIAVSLVFAGVYYLYLFFKDIEGQIK